MLLEILRFAQDDKLGVVYPTVGAIHESPVDFDVICPSVTPYGVPPADGGGLPLSLCDISLTL